MGYFLKLRGKILTFDESVCTNGTININGDSLGIFKGDDKLIQGN